MKADQERVRILLSDTITLLCRNALHFTKHLRLEGVLGITVDDTEVFIVHINELLSEQLAPPALRVGLDDLGSYLTSSSVIPVQEEQIGSGPETASVGKVKREDRDGNSVESKRHRTSEPMVLAAHHHANPNVVTGSVNMASQFVRCPPGALISSDCHENLAPISINTAQEPKSLAMVQRVSKDDKSSMCSQEAAQHNALAPASSTILLDQWHFSVPKRPAERPVSLSTAESSHTCYIQYGSGELTEVSGISEKKTSIYPQLSVLPVQFAAGVAMAAVDYNTTAQAPTVIGGRSVDCAPVRPDVSDGKLWNDASNVIQQNSTSERFVFDSVAGCSSWTVSQLMTSQGIMGSDEQHETHTRSMTQLALGGPEASNCSDLSVLSQPRGSKESRRSWTSKHKPHACQHPGCCRSYFFVHDLKRHLRQKHNGVDFSLTGGHYEADLGDATARLLGADCQRVTASPMTTLHDTDDQSPDSDDDDTDVLMATAAHHLSNLET